MFWLYILFFILFIFITWNNFYLSLCLLFFLLPTYLIKFNLGFLPTTLLEVMFWIIFITWLIKWNKRIIYKLKKIIIKNPNLFISISIFLISVTISIFTSTNLRSALGEWKAFYIEPILLFFILIITLKEKKQINNLIFALILSGLITSILSIYQHFTGWMVPYSFWQNNNTFRVTGWYDFPNAVSLFLSPLTLLSLLLINKKNWYTWIIPIIFIISSILAVIFCKSTGGLVGITTGFSLLLLFYKKTRLPIILAGLVGIIIIVSLPQSSYIKQELFFQDRSGQIRISMWKDTINFLKVNPLWGAGLASYQKKIKPYHTRVNGEGIEIFHHPHNIFLTMWVNLGILGLIGFVWIVIWFFRVGLMNLNKQTKILLASMLIIVVMGLVDSPYIKNDLAILFWLLPVLMIIFLKNKKFV